MSLLILGVLIWSFVHLFPSVLPGLRQKLESKLGENPYRGLFSLVILGALILIVLGWKSAVPSALYTPPLAGGPATSVLVLIGFVLFFAAQFPGNIKRFIRHPQLTGTLVWGVAHLLVNGDTRSVTLFGCLAAWAALEIIMINRRDGQWQKPGPAAIKFDVIPVIIGSVAFAAIFFFHGSLFGVSPLPGR